MKEEFVKVTVPRKSDVQGDDACQLSDVCNSRDEKMNVLIETTNMSRDEVIQLLV